MRRYITFITLVAVSLRGFLAHGHLCNVSRDSRGSAISSEKWHDAGNQVHVKVDCSSRYMVQIPTGVSNDVTELDLRGNKIDFVQENVPRTSHSVVLHVTHLYSGSVAGVDH